MNKFIIIIIIILSGLATFVASGQEKREFRPIVPGQFTAQNILAKAKEWEGKYYRRGQSCQCANWVGSVVAAAGRDLPAGHSWARNWLKWGNSVPRAAMRPGDIIVTWRGSRHGSEGHILIYVGDGQCIHRPTRSKPVQKVALSVFAPKILGVRRG